MTTILYNTVTRFQQLLSSGEIRAVKFTIMLAELARGISLIYIGHAFDKDAYTIMEYVIPYPHAWAVIWLTCAACRFYVLASGNYHCKFSLYFTGISAFVWWFTTISIYISSETPAASMGSSLALACMSLWLFIRVGWVSVGTEETHADS